MPDTEQTIGLDTKSAIVNLLKKGPVEIHDLFTRLLKRPDDPEQFRGDVMSSLEELLADGIVCFDAVRTFLVMLREQ